MPVLLLVIWVEGAVSAFIILACSLFHEAGHFFMLKLRGADIISTDIELLGAKISYRGELTSYTDDLLIAAGGVLFNIIFALAGMAVMMHSRNELVLLIIAANLALAAVNLLPISFLDGGCMLYSGLSLVLCDEACDTLCRIGDLIGRAILIAVNTALLIASGMNLGLLVLLAIQLMGLASG